jgi:hypothetical protein
MMRVEKLLNVRGTFFVGEKYRLDLVWDSIEYVNGKLLLSNAKFTGPAMDDAEKIKSNDHIDLDFYKQYYVKVKSVYIVRLSWGEVKYSGKDALLKDCHLSHKEIVNAPKFSDTDYIVIDTKMHRDENTHKFSPTYDAMSVNIDGSLYDFFGNLI